MKNLRNIAILIAAIVGHAAVGAEAATTLLDDTFTDGDYTNQSLTGSATWLIKSDHSAVAGLVGPPNVDAPTVVVGTSGSASLRTTNLGAFYDWKSYFTAAGAPQVLGNGDSISVSFSVATTLVNPTGANGFRVGLFNSGGTRQTANETPYAGAVFDGHVGYFAQFTPNATASTTTANTVRQRAGGATNGLFQGTLTDVSTVGTPVVGTTAAFDTVLPVSLTITRSADGLKNTITSSFAGASITSDDTTSPYASFDEVAIFFGSGWGAAGAGKRSNYIDDVLITYNAAAAVPEPVGLSLLGLGGLVALRRRRA